MHGASAAVCSRTCARAYPGADTVHRHLHCPPLISQHILLLALFHHPPPLSSSSSSSSSSLLHRSKSRGSVRCAGSPRPASAPSLSDTAAFQAPRVSDRRSTSSSREAETGKPRCKGGSRERWSGTGDPPTPTLTPAPTSGTARCVRGAACALALSPCVGAAAGCWCVSAPVCGHCESSVVCVPAGACMFVCE
eukprot:3764264-Rhodomonas_salina.1